MSKNFHRGLSHCLQRAPKSRRPPDVSRRQRKKRQHLKKLGFETLEDRRVMSAQSPLADLEMVSYSSATPEGQVAILQRELEWYALQSESANTSIKAEFQLLSIPTDPLLPDQWHLINLGQQVGNPDFQNIFAVAGEDINVAPVWNMGITGDGVVVAVIDSGVERDHPDLAANIHPLLQLDALDQDGDANPEVVAFDPLIDLPHDPFNPGPWLASRGNAHGTAVAGVIAAVADNGLGGTGIAPNAQIVPIRLIEVMDEPLDPDDPDDPDERAAQFNQAVIRAFRYEIDEIDITNNSWGVGVPGQRFLAGPNPNQILAIRDSIFFGRDGLGVIHVFASGNDAGGVPVIFPEPVVLPDGTEITELPAPLNTSTYNGYVNSRYTIGVTGVDHDGFYNNFDGTITSYPETGASVFVAAPTGSNHPINNIVDNTGLGSGIVTTDTTGQTGFNIAPDPDTDQEFDRDFETDTDQRSRFNGTSAAAPMVSGVIALMLEANPNLTWRDVQEILVRSARQNAEFDTPQIGFDQGNLDQPGFRPRTQNTWIINQMPVFHDPDAFIPTIDPDLLTFRPMLDPALGPNHYQPTPMVNTTAAGFTISEGLGVYNEKIGYAHGVVDAELAVQLAQQWHTKNQALPDELTFTTFITDGGSVPAAEVAAEADQFIPGGIGGGAGFAAFWDEYFAEEPFTDNNPTNTRGGPLEFFVPDSNTMTLENLEIKLTIDNMAAAMDSMRILLVSPGGTHSELNHFFADDGGVRLQTQTLGTASGGGGSLGGPSTWTFSTNRSWGERSDSAIIFDPTTMEPAGTSTGGPVLRNGWQLHMENYSLGNSFSIGPVEIAWHGSPIGANTERVQGLIGIDDGPVSPRDGLFNFSRVNQTIIDSDGDPDTVRLGDVRNQIDETHESMAANVTVLAHRDVNANGLLDAGIDVLVDQFVTGADGNYYFDLLPDDYVISLDSASLGGNLALDDSLTPAVFLPDYQAQWAISTDYFQVWDYDANLEIPINPVTDAPFAFIDGTGNAVNYGMKHINFLLDPDAPAAPQVEFNGIVTADFNGDGILNGNDTGLPGINVFGDVNRNGQFDSGEVLATTNASGQYTLIVPILATTVLNVGVIPPVDWTPSDPATGLREGIFAEFGDVFTDIDFAVQPPLISDGDESSQPGLLLGTVFDDSNEDTLRQTSEQGLANLTVYIDANNSGGLDPSELDGAVVTNVNGAFVFAGIAPGNYNLRIDLSANSELTQTSPIFNSPRNVTLSNAGTLTGIDFGVSNVAILDFGDLPVAYGLTTLGEDGARHAKGVYYLGTRIDTELDGAPSPNADGDDFTLDDDEDGITFISVIESGTQLPGATATIEAVASRYGGNLHAWIDFDGSESFEPGEQVLSNHALALGSNIVTFDLPDEIAETGVFARFRYGEFGLGITGPAAIGEVEDYELNIAAPATATNVVESNPDFDGDGVVGGFDFLAWQRGFGATSGAVASDGDANDDGAVNSDDLAEWGAVYSTDTNSATVSVAPQTGDFNLDGQADGHDFFAWQRGFGTEEVATLDQGDGTQDGNVDANDLSVWSNSYGVLGGNAGSGSPQNVTTLSAGTFARSPQVFEVSERGIQESDSVPAKIVPQRSDLSGVALARHLQRFGTSARSTISTGVGARYENHTVDTYARIQHDLAELGIAQRDRALDHLFAGRRGEWEILHREQDEADVAKEALASALSEEINWRVG